MKTVNIEKVISFVKKRWMLIIAILGVLLLIVSFIPTESKKTESKYTTEQYIEDTENKLVEVISKIIGNEDIRVMITLDTSVENIYADATKINTNTTENQASGNNTKTERKDSEEKEYIIVKDSDGNEQALIETTVMPQIRGVLVVCPGSNDDAISETVRNAVVTVLNINAKKVCVVSSLN